MNVHLQEALATPDFRNPELAHSRLGSIADALRQQAQIAMVIEASSHCDLACTFCAPHSDLVPEKIFNAVGPVTKRKQHMSMDTFSAIVDKLQGHRPLKMMFFHGNGEPLLNTRLEEFVRLAKAEAVAQAVTIVTNGTLLTAERFLSLVRAGVNVFRVSLDYITPEVYRRIKGVDRAGRVVDNLEACIASIKGQALPVKLSIECKEWRSGSEQGEDRLIYEHFSPLIEGLSAVSIRRTREHNWIDQANKGTSSGVLFVRRLPCEQPFYMMMVHSDGDISMCCVDSKKELLLGNIVKTASLNAILQSERLREWRRAHLQGAFDELPACQQCDLASAVDQPLFDHREELLTILSAQALQNGTKSEL